MSLYEPVSDEFTDAIFEKGRAVEQIEEWIPVLLRIRNRQGQLIRLCPNAAQRLYTRNRGARNIILKARQVGMTTWIAARFFLETLFRPGTVTLQVAHTLESAQQIFRIVHRFFDHLLPSIQMQCTVVRSNVRELAFAETDSRYIVDTAGNRRAGRGLTIRNLHASEVALWPGDPKETMAALLAAVPADGRVELESSPDGARGYFHAEWERATREQESGGLGRLVPHFFPWWLEPEYALSVRGSTEREKWDVLESLSGEEQRLIQKQKLAPEQIHWRRWMRAEFGDWAPQEYAESPAECFLASGRCVFDATAVLRRLGEIGEPARRELGGALWSWFEPVAGREYVLGADVAEGREGGDFSAAVLIDLETGLQCAEILARWPMHRFAEELTRLAQRYNTAVIAVERNNQGHAVLWALQRELAYPRIYFHPEGKEAAAGWPTNVQTKTMAIARLGKMIREASATLYSRRLLEQCSNYVYGRDGEARAQSGSHDDLVMAMAIALSVREQTAGFGAAKFGHIAIPGIPR